MSEELMAVPTDAITKPKSARSVGQERRRNISIAQRKKLVAEFLLSNMKQRDFCNEKDLAYSSFGAWLARYRKQLGGDSAPNKNLPAIKGATAMTGTTTTARAHVETERRQAERIAELEGQLRDCQVKIKSLVNTVILLGHQIGDDK